MLISLATFEHLPKRVGGLAEAATSIGESLAKEHEVCVVMPSHSIHKNESDLQTKEYGRFIIHAPLWSAEVIVYEAFRNGVRMYLLSDEAMDHPEVYAPMQAFTQKLLHFTLAYPAFINMMMSKEHKKPDVIHTNDWHCVLGGALAKKLFNIPMIYTIHRICKEKIALSDMANAGLLDLYDKDCVEEINGVPMFNIETFGCKICDMVNTVSYSYLEEEWSTLFGKYAGKSTYVWNGMDSSFWDQTKLKGANMSREERRKELLRENGLLDGPTFFYVGRFDMEQKGVDHLLNAISLIMEGEAGANEQVKQSIRFVILGSGDPGLEKLALEIEEKYPSNVKVVIGYLGREVTREYYGASDFTMVPSNFEPFGLVQLEAMCMGSIPIGSAVGGIKDTVIDISCGKDIATGKVIPPRNPLELAKAMVEMAGLTLNEKSKIEKIRSNGRPHVIEKFTWDRAANRYVDMYTNRVSVKLPFVSYEVPF